MSTVSIDLRKAHRSRAYGDLLAVWSWINDGRALFLIPHRRTRAPWFIVLEPAAHEWNAQDRATLELVIARAVKACDVLGIEPTPRNARKVISIVNDALPELIRMPSAPPVEYRSGTIGEMLLSADGQPLAGETIRVERNGVEYG